MNTTQHPLVILTAFGLLSTAALAQEPPAGATERAAGAEREIAGDTKPKDKLVGLPVESAAGEQLGSVVDIVRTKSGTPTYAVVAIDTDTTAVPYDTAMGMLRNDKVVMSPKKLADAPKVKQSEWLDETHTAWRKESDRYWGNTRTASKEQEKKPADR
jgi:PRC-barrel domain protein